MHGAGQEGSFFMSNNMETPTNNGAVFTILQIIKAVMPSAAKSEVGAMYINCQEAVPARHILKFMGHKQPPTPMQTDNTTALGVVNSKVMKKMKSMGMKYHWLQCRISQVQFRHYWASGGKLSRLCHKKSPSNTSPGNKRKLPYRHSKNYGIME